MRAFPARTYEREHFDALQGSFKVLINSFYGYAGFAQGTFNDFDLAEAVTARAFVPLGAADAPTIWPRYGENPRFFLPAIIRPVPVPPRVSRRAPTCLARRWEVRKRPFSR